MDALWIEGPCRLSGEVTVSGSKNATLPLLFASLLFDREQCFENVPRLWDVETTLKLLEAMGARCGWDKTEGTVRISPTITDKTAPYEWVRRMRAGVLALGPLLARYGEARVSLPGGCAIGMRPVNFHLDALKQLGADVSVEEGYVRAQVRGRMRGAEIAFPQVTVTGTENIMMAALGAEGETVLRNAACEPEVGALADYLRAAGAEISGDGTPTIRVRGGTLRALSTPWKMPPDRIETGTWISAAVATGSSLRILGTDATQLGAVLSVYREMGARVSVSADGAAIDVAPSDRYHPLDVETQPYPGFPTDMQAQVMLNLCQAAGTSRIRETIFENRFMHVAELNRLGARIALQGNLAIVEGGVALSGAPVMATDLRASACLVVAALMAHGETKVSRIYHLDRGYQRLDEKLSRLGARVRRVRD